MCVGLAVQILRDRQLRRQVMFYVMVLVLVQVAAGIAFLEDYLMGRPLLFGLYWLACLAVVVFALLLALYDFLMVRLEARAAERSLEERLKKEIERDLKEEDEDDA